MQPESTWRGEFDIPWKDDAQTDEPREEWGYTTPIAQFSGPDFPEAGAIAGEHPLYTGIHPSGPTLYLLARTLEAFARCISQYDIPVPVYFSCIYAVFRLNVPARRLAGHSLSC